MSVAILTVVLLLQAGVGPLSLEGQVVVIGTNSPVARARLVLAKVGGTAADYRTAMADANGQFRFSDVSAGSYRVFAERQGYLRGEYGRRVAGGTGIPVSLVAGQPAAPITIGMIPTGVITGRVTDEGRPARNVWVRALRATYLDGVRSFMSADTTPTDDLGEYRLFGLAPGTYFVSARPLDGPRIEGDTYVVPQTPSNANNNQALVRRSAAEALAAGVIDPAAYDRGMFLTAFYPGTTDVDQAIAVDVAPGSTRTGIDLMTVRTTTAPVRGRVINAATGQPADGVSVAVLSRPGDTVPIPSALVRAGGFELPSVPPGRYELVARSTTVNPRLSGTATIDVNPGGLDNVEIAIRPGMTIRGRVDIDGAPPGFPDRDSGILSVQLTSPSGGVGATRVGADGAFTIENVEPREYRLVVRYLRVIPPSSARFGADDVTNAPVRVSADSQGQELVIAVSLRTAVVEAQVTDGSARPVAGTTVALVPDPPRRNISGLYRTATTDAFGRIRLTDVVPGDYKVFAADLEPAAWQAPDVIERLEDRGRRVQVRPDSPATVSLRVTP